MKRLLGWLCPKATPSPRPRSTRLGLEHLEDRLVPTLWSSAISITHQSGGLAWSSVGVPDGPSLGNLPWGQFRVLQFQGC